MTKKDIYEKLDYLRALADYDRDKAPWGTEYCLEVSLDVYYKLKEDYYKWNSIVIRHDNDVEEIMGLPFMKTANGTDVIKLWREVK